METLKKLFFFILTSVLLLGSSVVWSQIGETDHWETIIDPHQIWHYFPASAEPPFNWKENDFDDSLWASGPGGIGYADGDDSTLIDPVISLYIRNRFDVLDTSNITALMFYMDFDDGFVAYINGVEIARANIFGSNPSFNTEATTYREATMYTGGLPQEFLISSSILNEVLIQGENVLAIQVHNHDINSSDLSAIPFLMVGIRDTTISYQEVPDWFVSPSDYYSSLLPIISIHTFGNEIVDEPKIRAEMGIINNGSGKLNHFSDPYTGYHGWINIEIRGESAQMFPKKSYGFETQDSLGENNNVPLLGLPDENDWILYGPYSDKTLIKNVLSLKLARDLGRYASRTQYCELFINNSYRGLYILMEKIKQDKNRVDIARLRPEDIEGDQLTGGYILRVDKIDDNDYPPFEAFPNVSIPGESPVSLQYFDPGGDELHVLQRAYIKDFIHQFEQALNTSSYLSYFTGYHEYVDKDALIDYMIINEISKNIDTYIFSTYMYKDRDSKGGKLTMGPVWDFNIAYGNVDYNSFAESSIGWMYDEGYRMYWFRRMMNDPALQNKFSCRWHELRSNRFSDEIIFGYIDSLVVALEDPVRDNFRRWPVLGQYVWPNSFIGNTHEEEIRYLKNWLFDRLHWMDANINESCVEAIDWQKEIDLKLNIYPNPFREELNIEMEKSSAWIKKIWIFDIGGKLVWSKDQGNDSSNSINWNGKRNNQISASKGIYLLKIELNDGYSLYKRVVKN
jgi:hypothetical protein